VIVNNEHTPVDRIQSNKASWVFDLLATNSDVYKMYLANDEVFTGTWASIINIAKDYSCKRIKDLDAWTENGVYALDTDWDWILTSTYCNMQIEWGGWTLALKANWDETTFEYDSAYWENSSTYNPTDYKYDDKEFKSDHFSNLPFNQVMLELKTGTKTRYVIVAISGDSLEELFSGWYTPSYLTRKVWKTIIDDSSLQTECNKEGFNTVWDWNAHNQTRFWIISNQEDNCGTTDSSIWIWIKRWSDSIASVWNYANFDPDNWDKTTSSFWYLYVR
jgi:hypothetical protein